MFAELIPRGKGAGRAGYGFRKPHSTFGLTVAPAFGWPALLKFIDVRAWGTYTPRGTEVPPVFVGRIYYMFFLYFEKMREAKLLYVECMD